MHYAGTTMKIKTPPDLFQFLAEHLHSSTLLFFQKSDPKLSCSCKFLCILDFNFLANPTHDRKNTKCTLRAKTATSAMLFSSTMLSDGLLLVTSVTGVSDQE